jgi:hypothetical protein
VLHLPRERRRKKVVTAEIGAPVNTAASAVLKAMYSPTALESAIAVGELLRLKQAERCRSKGEMQRNQRK